MGSNQGGVLLILSIVALGFILSQKRVCFGIAIDFHSSIQLNRTNITTSNSRALYLDRPTLVQSHKSRFKYTSPTTISFLTTEPASQCALSRRAYLRSSF